MIKISRNNKNNINFADSGALSDLAFLLIVFFIVIAVFNVNVGFIIGLPKKQSTKIINVEDIIKIRLDEENNINYDGEIITIEHVEDLVKERLKQRPNMTFLLKIHPEARYQDVVNIVDVVMKLDVDNFSFSMEEGEE